MRLKPKDVTVTQLINPKPVSKENKDTIEEESVKYDTFLINEFNKFEKQILASFDRNMPVEKSVTAFISDIFNVVNTKGWYKKLQRVISFTFKQGVEEAEKETKVDIGVGIDFNKKVDTEAYRQMNGFPLPDGKSWPGIKGVSKELENDIMAGVSDSMIKGESNKETRERIQKVFKTYTGSEESEGRVDRIARTETNRMYNQEKLESYKRSGVKGVKVWNTFIDDRTGELDKRMDGQIVELDEPFTDPVTGTQFMHPPTRPNCRCLIQFEADKK